LTAVLDAWAVLALLQQESANRRVREAVASGLTIMSSVNLGEVHYKVARAYGYKIARDRTAAIRRVVSVEDPDWELVSAAAEVKADGGVSYADAFCIATAARHGMPLMTGDPEIVERAGGVEVLDLRSPDR
jgi:PIN domain nuclease of toxin-antitoxin system